MHILDRIAETESNLRGQAFNAPVEYPSLKASMFRAADLLAEIYAMCRFTNQLEADLAECLRDAISTVNGMYGPNTLLARSVTQDWQAVLAKVTPSRLTSLPPDACGGGIVDRESDRAAGAGEDSR